MVQGEDYLTKLTVNDCERKHTGIYKITAKNDSGTDEAELEIVVLGEYQSCIIIYTTLMTVNYLT